MSCVFLFFLLVNRLLDYDVCLHRAQDIMETITERNRLPCDGTLYTKVLNLVGILCT